MLNFLEKICQLFEAIRASIRVPCSCLMLPYSVKLMHAFQHSSLAKCEETASLRRERSQIMPLLLKSPLWEPQILSAALWLLLAKKGFDGGGI